LAALRTEVKFLEAVQKTQANVKAEVIEALYSIAWEHMTPKQREGWKRRLNLPDPKIETEKIKDIRSRGGRIGSRK
jgi:hypothetical protein